MPFNAFIFKLNTTAIQNAKSAVTDLILLTYSLTRLTHPMEHRPF